MWVTIGRCQRKRCPCCTLVVALLALTGLGHVWGMTVQAQTRSADEAAAVRLATRTLADELKVQPDSVTLRSVAAVEWRDSSLGCPERGRIYSQVLVNGHRVELRHDGRDYTVHVGAGRAVVCGDGRDRAKVPADAVVSAAKPATDRVKAAVAARAGVPAAEVRIDRSRPFRAGLTCPAAPSTPRGAAFIVDARVGDKTFVYYADDDVTVECEAK